MLVQNAKFLVNSAAHKMQQKEQADGNLADSDLNYVVYFEGIYETVTSKIQFNVFFVLR